ncbi:MAG: MGMT family protein [Methylococcaceae bacterium]|jgi:methylated-DNA-[protein]-cysteine S-methyltransferase
MTFIIQWVENSSGSQEIIKINTPAGQLAITNQQGVISKVEWKLDDCIYTHHQELQQPFEEYWFNPNKHITLKLLKQGSDYRYKVWTELCKIPFGRTMTYSALAKKIDSSARAVGNACRDNPYPVIIPCHRVVSVAGKGGYCGHSDGYFMDIKTQLLNFEATYKQ